MNQRVGRIIALAEVDVARDESLLVYKRILLRTQLSRMPVQPIYSQAVPEHLSRLKSQVSLQPMQFLVSPTSKKAFQESCSHAPAQGVQQSRDWKEYMKCDRVGGKSEFQGAEGSDDEWYSMEGSQEAVKNSSIEPKSDKSSENASNSENGPA
uniref:Uncharacterized protein n=1 Tax=Ditylenchus dipsaci TaxID=166011 RepID=A0A915DA16_9BILA